MHSLRFAAFLAALGGSALVAAQQSAVLGSLFESDPKSAAADAAPAWHMDKKTCMPADATNGHGGPNPGLPSDNCNELKIDHNCPAQPKFNGPNTEATPFPTYYVVRHCDGDNSWRIVYDVYFPKDTGHRHDWEWAIVKFADDGTNTDHWVRDGIWMERDGNTPYTKWDQLESTFAGTADMDQDGQKGRDHPKLYFGKFHHPVFDTQQTKWFANTCPPISEDDYRDNDYRYFASDSLVDGSVINPSWNYGHADSFPAAFGAGAKHDVCNYK